MSQYSGGYRSATSAGGPGDRPTTEVARDETAALGRTGVAAAGQVAGTAAEQARNVAQEAKAQARDLVGEARYQVQEQARNGQRKAGEGVRALGRELREMAEGGQQQSGPASQVARQIADRADKVADWMGEREPGDLLEEVRSMARRRPGAFLVGAGLAGAIIGRLTRGVVDAAGAPSGVRPVGSRQAPDLAYGPPGSVPERPGPLTYDSPVAPPLAPPGAAPEPYAAAGLDPYQPAPSGDPLGTPTPTAPATLGAHAAPSGARGAAAYADELDRATGRRSDGLSDQPFQSQYRGPR